MGRYKGPRRKYTMIEHKWLELITDKRKYDLSPNELRVMIIVFRLTYGRTGDKPTWQSWRRIYPEDIERITGIPVRSVTRALNRLRRLGLIERKKHSNRPGDWQYRPTEKIARRIRKPYSELVDITDDLPVLGRDSTDLDPLVGLEDLLEGLGDEIV